MRRLALQAGEFGPASQPVSDQELERLLMLIEASGDLSVDDQAVVKAWKIRVGAAPRIRPSSHSCVAYSELGDVVSGEAGLALAPGWNVTWETGILARSSNFWMALAPRLVSGFGSAGVDLDREDPLTWPGWVPATGQAPRRGVRVDDDRRRIDVPRSVIGYERGAWSLTIGRQARRSGPGLDGTLAIDTEGVPFPAATLRRTRPLAWSGPLRRWAPSGLLLRMGLLSKREIRYQDDRGVHSWRARPWFFQWRLGWRVFSWFRIGAEHSVMAATDDGTLWPDLLQLNFPLKGTTWRETASGPVTDRIFNLQMESRWPAGAWQWLRLPAGRVWWQYGGTDFLPSGPAGLIPQISVPASVAGCEWVSLRMDLAVEYAELQHEKVLWYSNGGFPEGYTHEGWVLGHPLGGSGESYSARVRLRPGSGWESAVLYRHRNRGMNGSTPGTSEQRTLALEWRQLAREDRDLNWSAAVEWHREKADPGAYGGPGAVTERQWFRSFLRLSWR